MKNPNQGGTWTADRSGVLRRDGDASPAAAPAPTAVESTPSAPTRTERKTSRKSPKKVK